MSFCFHKWSEWSDPVEAHNGHKQQWKRCKKCNKADFRMLRWDGQTSIILVRKTIQMLRGEA